MRAFIHTPAAGSGRRDISNAPGIRTPRGTGECTAVNGERCWHRYGTADQSGDGGVSEQTPIGWLEYAHMLAMSIVLAAAGTALFYCDAVAAVVVDIISRGFESAAPVRGWMARTGGGAVCPSAVQRSQRTRNRRWGCRNLCLGIGSVSASTFVAGEFRQLNVDDCQSATNRDP
jgi:hypothetical protein